MSAATIPRHFFFSTFSKLKSFIIAFDEKEGTEALFLALALFFFVTWLADAKMVQDASQQ